MTGERRDRNVHQEAPDANDEAKGNIALTSKIPISYLSTHFHLKFFQNNILFCEQMLLLL